MKIWRKVDIKKRLIISFLILLLIPSSFIGMFSYNTAKQKVEEQVLNNAQGNLQLLNHIVNKFLEPQLQNVEMLSENINSLMYQGQSSPQVMNIIHQFQRLHPEITSAYVGTEVGFLIADGTDKLPPDYDPRKRPWYQNAKQAAGKIVISEPYTDMLTGEIIIGIDKVLKDGSGVVGIDMKVKKISEMISSVKIGKEGYTFIVDKNKKIVVHPLFKYGSEVTKAISDPLFRQQTGSYDTTGKGSVEKTFFVTNELTGWKIGGAIPMSEVEGEATPIFQTTVTVIFIALLLGVVLVYFVISSITRPLKKLNHASEAISNGDLTERVLIESDDELGRLGVRFNQMSDSLQTVLQNIMGKSEQLATASEELMQGAKEAAHVVEHVSNTIQQVAAGSEQQAKNSEETSVTITHMSEAVRHISSNAQKTSIAIAKTSNMASLGNEAIGLVIYQMDCINKKITELSNTVRGLNERSNQIENFVDIITSIAEQINLLSLNAAIEAAHAGEHGRGFAIVAGEVRKLAEQSSQSAGKITHLIHAIQNEIRDAVVSMDSGVNEVQKGVEAVQAASSSFKSIYSSVEEVTEQIHQVSASVQELSEGSKTIATSAHVIVQISQSSVDGIQSVSSITEEQLATMEEIAASAQTLAYMADELEEIIKSFKM
ncbi:methyl-accepting chemotaxis protein [Aneurinibacillus terranovensis]|uniref:methyl-accepting chemotaxis protein n=1 Tax=Aneurinibacillus terranovensis TaxID=278991 RepID=UPI00041363A4|nr:methyl-accepting chemotaxis protein [Aneurinibacillus terranovensis]